jgi:hypothetical protein
MSPQQTRPAHLDRNARISRPTPRAKASPVLPSPPLGRLIERMRQVSGVAALLVERNPALRPAQVRKILMVGGWDRGTPSLPAQKCPILHTN